MKKKYKHIYFEDISTAYPMYRTSVYICREHNECTVGWIFWSNNWRQYTFSPHTENKLAFGASCLSDISNFINQLMAVRATSGKPTDTTSRGVTSCTKKGK